MKIFAKRLRELRQEKELSPRGLADEIGVSDSTISRWEREEISIADESIVKLALFFEVSADYLLGLEN